MCGIAGLIGKSKNPEISFKLLSALLSNSEIRGTDATGIYAATHGDNPEVIYHKEPIRASKFIEGDFWKNLQDLDMSVALCHARGASAGVGKPDENSNNHPFKSSSLTLGLAHNGKLTDVEIATLNKRYKRVSNCDSELLLRIIEAAEDSDELDQYVKVEELKNFDDNMQKRLKGFRDIWCQVGKGAMTVTLVEILPENGKRRFWITRNDKRPLWFVDLRKALGQIFFFSVPEVWKLALKDCIKDNLEVIELLGKKVRLHEVPENQIWMFEIDNDNIEPNKNTKIQITHDGKTSVPLDKLKKYEIKESKPSEIVKNLRTMLGEKDEVIKVIDDTDDDGIIIGELEEETHSVKESNPKTSLTEENISESLNSNVMDEVKEMKARIESFVNVVHNNHKSVEITDESMAEISSIISDVNESLGKLHSVVEQ